MEAKDQDAGRVAEDAEGQAPPGDPGSSGGPEGQENPARNSSGEAGAVAREGPQPGPRGDALLGPLPVPLRRRRLQLYPFRGVAGRGKGTGRRAGRPGVRERRGEMGGWGDPGG